MASLRATKLLGLNGNDIIYGTAASEQIFGFCGDDKIYGGGGDDTIYGGIGFDTAYFSEACSNYQIVRVAGGLQITHIKGSRADGSDFVSSDVERIVFGGTAYNSSTCGNPAAGNIARPVAKADTNWVKEDSNLAATGNVLKSITHGGAPVGTFADRADTDADTAVLHVKNPGIIFGTYGKLVLAANGAYTYTLYTQAEKPAAFASVQALNASSTPLIESFTYSVTDGPHAASSTLKISVFGTDDGVKIAGLQIEGADQTVFESNLSGSRGSGETDGSAPNAAALTPSGTFTVQAPDGLGNLSVGVTQVISNGAVINLNMPIITTFGVLKITAINLSTGVVSYTYTLADNTVAHGSANNGANAVIDTIAISLSDKDGSHASANLTVKVVDDVPSIHLTETAPQALTVDDSDLATDASALFSGLFVSAYGADGPGSTSYALGINGGATGLIDTLSGQAVVLSLNGGVVEGRTVGGNDLVFKISINNAGVISLDQVRALKHPDASNSDESVALASSNLVTLTATVTDGDGDTVAQTASIGSVFHFKDDAPVATNDGQTATEGGAAIVTTAATGVLANDHAGADFPGHVTAVVGGAIDSEFSGQFGNLTLHGDGSYTYVPNASVAAGSVDSFTYTLTDADGDASTAVLSFTFHADGHVPTAGVSFTLVDEDDLPAGNHDDAPGDDVQTLPPGTLTHDYGVDGPGFIKLTGGSETVNGVTYTYMANPSGTELRASDGTHDVFKVVLTDAVAGTYFVELLSAIDHPMAGTEDNLAFKIGYEVFDADSVTGVAGTLNISVDDDLPTAGDACIVLTPPAEDDGHDDGENQDESGGNSNQSQSSSSSDGNSGDDDGSGASVYLGTLIHSYGADQNGHIALCSVTLPSDGGFTQTGSGNQIIISQDDIQILQIDLLDPVTGSYKLTQLAGIHDDSAGGHSGDTSSSSSENASSENSGSGASHSHDDGDDDAAHVAFTLSYSVTDGDGDVVKGALTIKLSEPSDDSEQQSSEVTGSGPEICSTALVSDDGHAFAFDQSASTDLPSDIIVPLAGDSSDGQQIADSGIDLNLLTNLTGTPFVPAQNENHEGLL